MVAVPETSERQVYLDTNVLRFFMQGVARRLSAYRGITRLGALTLAAEVCDWRRFPRAAALIGFCGLVPSEYSSGASTHRGHLTKAGNAHLRAQLIESAWAYQHHPTSAATSPPASTASTPRSSPAPGPPSSA